jgi:hypothetical protein
MRCYLKIIEKQKWAEGITQMVKPSKYETLSSNPVPPKKGRKEGKVFAL